MTYTPSISVVRSWYVGGNLEGDQDEAFDRFIRNVQAAAIRRTADVMLDAKRGLPFDDDYDIAIVSTWTQEWADDVEAGK